MLQDINFYRITGLTPTQARKEPAKFIFKLLLCAETEASMAEAQAKEFQRK